MLQLYWGAIGIDKTEYVLYEWSHAFSDLKEKLCEKTLPGKIVLNTKFVSFSILNDISSEFEKVNEWIKDTKQQLSIIYYSHTLQNSITSSLDIPPRFNFILLFIIYKHLFDLNIINIYYICEKRSGGYKYL